VHKKLSPQNHEVSIALHYTPAYTVRPWILGTAQCTCLHPNFCTHTWRDGRAELTWVPGYTPRWFTHLQYARITLNIKRKLTERLVNIKWVADRSINITWLINRYSTWFNTGWNIILGSDGSTVRRDGLWQFRQTINVTVQLNDKVTWVPNVSHECRLSVIWKIQQPQIRSPPVL